MLSGPRYRPRPLNRAMGNALAPMSYRLCAKRPESAVVMAILESWCISNCTGAWKADHPNDQNCEIDFAQDDDLILFMMSSEYHYMGNPPIQRLA